MNFSKFGVNSRAVAIVRAHEAGFGYKASGQASFAVYNTVRNV